MTVDCCSEKLPDKFLILWHLFLAGFIIIASMWLVASTFEFVGLSYPEFLSFPFGIIIGYILLYRVLVLKRWKKKVIKNEMSRM